MPQGSIYKPAILELSNSTLSAAETRIHDLPSNLDIHQTTYYCLLEEWKIP